MDRDSKKQQTHDEVWKQLSELVIHRLIKDTSICEQWVKDGTPSIESFHEHHREIVTIIKDVWNEHKTLLSRTTLEIRLADAKLGKQKIIADAANFSKIQILMYKPMKELQEIFGETTSDKDIAIDYPEFCKKLIQCSGSSNQENDKLRNLLNDKISLAQYYDKAHPTIQRLTQLLYSLSDKMPASAHFMVAHHLLCGMIGKKLVGMNKGREYYCNNWLSVLAPTATGKSDIRTIERMIKEIEYDWNLSPYSVMEDRFTMFHAFSDFGGTIETKKLKTMNDDEKRKEKKRIYDECRAKSARLIISDEFAHTFPKIIKSGSLDGELGQVLQMADSGATISGSTATDGYRVINDCCVSMVGYSQPDIWHSIFDPASNLESGLIGRFFIMNIDDYKLDIDKLPINGEVCRIEIRSLLAKFVAKATQLPDRVYCDFDPDPSNDMAGAIYDNVMSNDPFKSIVKSELVSFDKIRGKVIYQAIKYTMLDSFLSLSDNDISSLKLNILDHDTKCRCDALVNWDTFRRYLILILCNAVKLFTANAPKGELEMNENRIYLALRKAKGNIITLRDIQRMNLKRDNFLLKSNDIRDIVYGLEERGIVKTGEASKGRLFIKWTGKVCSSVIGDGPMIDWSKQVTKDASIDVSKESAKGRE